MSDKHALQASYDRIATQYAASFFDELSRKPFDRQLLGHFAENVRQQNPQDADNVRNAVWDLGCGPGHVARYLHGRGLSVGGLDLSEQMVACAQRLNPHITFQQGTMLALPSPNASLAGIVSFYAIIHLTRSEAAAALREFWRVLRPGGYLLLAFHGGEGETHVAEWFGEPVDVSATFFGGEEMAQYARQADFTILDLLERPPYEFELQTPRLYLLAQKPNYSAAR